MIYLYRVLTWLITPLAPLLLRRRLARGKEDKHRLAERLGKPSVARPTGTVLWIHAASVGEANAVLPLIDALLAQHAQLHILLTTVTVTSAALMHQRLPERAIHQFVPLDTPGAVQSFIRHWQPDIAVWVDSELWPNLILETAESGAVLGMVNARISERSFERWQRLGNFMPMVLSRFTFCYAQSTQDAQRLQTLGVRFVEAIGNLKYDAPPLPCDAMELEKLRALTHARVIWLAASTHAGEEEMIGQVHARLRQQFPTLLTVIIPRHPERGTDIAHLLAPLEVSQRSRKETITPQTQIYIADTMGEVGLFFRLARAVFMGKSLVGKGGQNPIEAARLGCAIVAGNHTENFAQVYEGLQAVGGCLQVEDEDTLFHAVGALLANADYAAGIAHHALRYATSQQGLLKRIVEEISTYLD